MSRSERPPGSREEDAWLSDQQLARCAPAETEPFQSPVPTRMVSNGEYMPHPQTQQQKHVELRIKELADMAAKKLGISRRKFLAGSGGMAAAFLAMNEVFGKRFFNVSAIELFEPSTIGHVRTDHGESSQFGGRWRLSSFANSASSSAYCCSAC